MMKVIHSHIFICKVLCINLHCLQMCAKHVGNQMRTSINGLAVTNAGGGIITHALGFGESPRLDRFLSVHIASAELHNMYAFQTVT